MALLSLLARIGTSEPVEAVASLDELAGTFDFSHFGRAPAHFDPHDVELLNAKLLHHLDYAEVADRLPEGVGEAEWLVLRGSGEGSQSPGARVVEGPFLVEDLNETSDLQSGDVCGAVCRPTWCVCRSGGGAGPDDRRVVPS